MERVKLAISGIELESLDPVSNFYRIFNGHVLTRIIRKANELGLEGKKIKEIVGVCEESATGQRYIDFVCE